MSRLKRWADVGQEFGWRMPAKPPVWWKRLPLVRHVRAIWLLYQIERWYGYGPGSIGLRSGYDDWVVEGIWLGQESPR